MVSEPTNIIFALKHPQWRQVMSKEFDALTKYNTWSLVPSTAAHNLVVANGFSM